jgi:SpoVK/Ycf46/Vps4 family AAA+-type ATPase
VIYIEECFRRSVYAHLVANLCAEIPTFPLILGIFGPPGEGKTFQVEHLCQELGITQFLISPGELESENAGAPGQLLRAQYLQAANSPRKGCPSALVIHDIDTILGRWGDLVQYTVNRQVVYAQLMAFCDFPQSVAGQTCERVPIIVTGNNPSVLYGPLMRPGRMRLFPWNPSDATRVEVVKRIFPELKGDDVAPVVGRYREKPLSFWADVKSFVLEDRVYAGVSSLSDEKLRHTLSSRSRIRVSTTLRSIPDLVAAIESLDTVDIREQSYLGECATVDVRG